ncbi:MAG: hypothetical protein ACC707_18860 [Thiohalomonadales bacterium]
MNLFKILLSAIFLLTLSSFAFGSGSHDSDSSASSEYNKGKKIVYNQLLCDSCPLKSAELDKAVAKDIVTKLNVGDESLGKFVQSDVKLVVSYLQERFSL